jgi:hypothetical protein
MLSTKVIEPEILRPAPRIVRSHRKILEKTKTTGKLCVQYLAHDKERSSQIAIENSCNTIPQATGYMRSTQKAKWSFNCLFDSATEAGGRDFVELCQRGCSSQPSFAGYRREMASAVMETLTKLWRIRNSPLCKEAVCL